MKVLSVSAVIALAALLSLACGSSEESKNGNQNVNTPTMSSANANAGEGSQAASNSNASASAPASNANRAATDSKTTAKIDAASLFSAQKCIGCHGPDGKGKTKGTPNFTDAAWQKAKTDSELAEGIKKGSVPKMPAFGTKLSDDEVKALVSYVRTFSGK